MAYLSLYRKWRPQTFDDVVGQRHVVQTLVNALNNRRTAHAYLFCGPRGTGKTTVARLLAKGLNCAQGPTGQLCNECENCKRIAAGGALDVIEIDGASNRGIDEIRDIRERVHYAPTQGVYKVYIVDEVHMLTNEAFNALLKILEEPPAHVIFVFATTEAHKIPATIISRCQRFDFHRFRPTELVDQLRKVLKGEGVTFEEPALGLVARHAEGGMRDALAVLDQCIAYSPEGVTVAVVNEVLGTAPRERLVQFVRTHIEGSIGDLLVLIRELDEASTDLRQFTGDVIGYLRDLMILKASGPEADRLMTLLDAEKDEAAELANKLSLDQIIRAVEIMGEVENNMRWAPSPTLALELACVRLMELIKSGPEAATVVEQEPQQHEVPVSTAPEPARPVASQRPVAEAAQGEPKRTPRPEAQRPERPSAAPVADERRPTAGAPSHRPASSASEQPGDLDSIWNTLLQALHKERLRQIEAFLREGAPVRLTSNSLIISFPTSRGFHHANMEKPEQRQPTERLLSRIVGRAITLDLRLGEVSLEDLPPAQGTESASSEAASRETKSPDDHDEPAVRAALQIFGGKVTEVRREEDHSQ